MAGLFDDLVPSANAAKPQGFEDLVPKDKRQPFGAPQELSIGERLLSGVELPAWMDNLRGATPFRVMQGMADPVVGAAQTVANLLPDSTGIPQAVNQKVADVEKQYEAARAARGNDGIDVARLAGNALSPVNAVIAAKVPMAATAGMRALQGAGIGGATAAMEPVTDATDGRFWSRKGGQVAAGVVTGGILTPVLGKVADTVVARFAREAPNAAVSGAQTDAAIIQALREMGQDIREVPPAQIAELRQQVLGALQQGKKLDPAALLRQSDFDSLGMNGTLGQITRDPMQFARERNLRGVENLGEPLSARFATQGNQLSARLGNLAEGAGNSYQAGTRLTESLKGTDEALRRHVSGLYQEARASAGKDLDVPLTGLAQDYAQVVGDFGDKVPSAIRAKFAALGLDPSMPSNQQRVFTLEDANKLQTVINEHVGADRATNTALGRLRTALRSAVESADPSGGPFAQAVGAAKGRFQLQDAVPALKAAADGDIAPDDFVRRFIVGGKTNEVKGLAEVLKSSDPAAFNEARAQLGDELRRAAYSVNAAGDKPFAPDRYMNAIRRIGVDKLGAFFNPQEVQDILTVGRVGAYINQAPNAAAVNASNTAGALMNVASRIPGLPAAVGVVKSAADSVKNRGVVNSALRANLTPTPAELTDRQNWLIRLMTAGGIAGAGSLAGGAAGR